MYWFQLQESIGPIVINVSRVVADIFTMSISLLLFCMAFTFGIVFVLNIDQVDPSQSEILNSTNNQNSTIQQTMVRRMLSIPLPIGMKQSMIKFKDIIKKTAWLQKRYMLRSCG